MAARRSNSTEQGHFLKTYINIFISPQYVFSMYYNGSFFSVWILTLVSEQVLGSSCTAANIEHIFISKFYKQQHGNKLGL